MNKQQLAAKIWASANKMRSKIEANEYKDYILGFIFYKFLSDNEIRHLKEVAYWSDDEIKSDLNESDAEAVRYCQDNLGYFISYDNLFSTWLGLGVDFSVSNVTDALNAFPANISNEENKHRVFKNIFKTLSDGITKLGGTPADRTKAITKLIRLIKDIPTDGSQDYDVLGFIYEYLIENFAANAGKKAGEFYTPHEVSLLMAEIVADHLKDRDHIDIYDPTSGSGSLLINIGHAVAKYMKDKSQVKYYAQELKENTFNLTRMNLVMRGIDADNILVRCGDTLEDDWPFFKESEDGKIIEGTYNKQTVDAVVSNPPYSQSWDPTGKKEDQRFKHYGVAPRGKADYAFLLHDLCHINDDGIVTIVLPHGVLFRPGDDYNIRKNLIDNNNIDAIIGLPADIFYGTGIATLVMVLKRHRPTTDVLIIDASKLSVKEGKKNKLTASDIRRIADTVINRTETSKFSRKVNRDTIIENDYNLNIPRYVDSSDALETWDAYATMFGGIPDHEIDLLSEYWNTFPSLRSSLFIPKDGTPCSVLVPGAVNEVIQDNSDVTKWKNRINASLESLPDYLRSRLIDNMLTLNVHREESILAGDIYNRLDGQPLIDRYNAYQILDNQWTQIFTDLEMLQTEGFETAKVVDPNMVVKKAKNENEDDIEVQKGWKGHVLPFELVQSILLSDELEALQQKQIDLNAVEAQYSELMQGLPDEDKEAYLNDDNTDFDKKRVTEFLLESFADTKIGKVKLTAKNLFQQIYKNALWSRFAENSTENILAHVAGNIERQKALKKEVSAMEKALHELTKTTIENLSDDEVRTMLYEKWVHPLYENLLEIPQVIIEKLTSKVSVLATKYEIGLAEVEKNISIASKELSSMLDELTGSVFDMQAYKEFKNTLPGGLAEIMRTASLEKMFPRKGETSPQVRFKGFSGEWEEHKLKEITQRITRKNEKLESRLALTISAQHGLIAQEEFFNRRIASSQIQGYFLIKKGEFAYNKSYSSEYPVGAVKCLTDYDMGVLSTLYIVFSISSKIEPNWISSYFETSNWHSEIIKRATEGARNHGLLNISPDDFFDIPILIPSDPQEQQAISHFFSCLDTLITAQERKVFKLRCLKKSFLGKMFVTAK